MKVHVIKNGKVMDTIEMEASQYEANYPNVIDASLGGKKGNLVTVVNGKPVYTTSPEQLLQAQELLSKGVGGMGSSPAQRRVIDAKMTLIRKEAEGITTAEEAKTVIIYLIELLENYRWRR